MPEYDKGNEVVQRYQYGHTANFVGEGLVSVAALTATFTIFVKNLTGVKGMLLIATDGVAAFNFELYAGWIDYATVDEIELYDTDKVQLIDSGIVDPTVEKSYKFVNTDPSSWWSLRTNRVTVDAPFNAYFGGN